MAENSSGKKYTVDEILAEYDSMHNDSAPANEAVTDNSEQAALTEPHEKEKAAETEIIEETALNTDENADDTDENNTGSAENADDEIVVIDDDANDDVNVEEITDEDIDIYDAEAPDEQQMINDIIGHIKPVESFSAEANSKTPEEIFVPPYYR